jgi:hypothetical protein
MIFARASGDSTTSGFQWKRMLTAMISMATGLLIEHAPDL